MAKQPKTINISIVGSCVTRDAFEIIKSSPSYDASTFNSYIVDKYVQSIHPISAISAPLKQEDIDQILSEIQTVNCPNFYKKMLKLDMSKSCFSYLSEKHSDYLILDLTNARYKLLNFYNDNKTFISEDLAKYPTFQTYQGQDSTLKNLRDVNVFDPLNEDEEFVEKLYFKYFYELTKLYPQKRIIIIYEKHTFSYVNSSVTISSENHLTTNIEQEKDRAIAFAYKCAKKYFTKAHFVPCLPTLVGNVNHKWGKSGLHFVDEVYQYIYTCVDYIINEKPKRTQEQLFILENLRKYSEIIFEKYYKQVNACIQRERNLINLSNGLNIGTYIKNGITLTINEDYSFSVNGTATDDTVFYLYSASKNATGGWISVKDTTEKGKYLFSTKVKCDASNFFIQLILTNNTTDKKWIHGNLSSVFTIDRDYELKLIRIVIKKGVSVNCDGEILLEKFAN